MGDRSKIQWTDATWNPVTGCTPVSEGCANCYAKREAEGRLRGRCGYDKDEPFKVAFHADKLDQPLRWRKSRRIFVCSMGDLFHEDVPLCVINDVFRVIQKAPQHTFIVLTKRAALMRNYMKAILNRRAWPKDDAPFSNVWLGVTAENQARADERIPILLDTPAAVRFVSVEPMLGPVDLRRWMRPKQRFFDALSDVCSNVLNEPAPHVDSGEAGLDWIICGGETGAMARVMMPRWALALRDQCVAARVPFFFKQWGEWCAPSQMPEEAFRSWDYHHGTDNSKPPVNPRCIGKKAAGRLLDGRTWDEYPEEVER